MRKRIVGKDSPHSGTAGTAAVAKRGDRTLPV